MTSRTTRRRILFFSLIDELLLPPLVSLSHNSFARGRSFLLRRKFVIFHALTHCLRVRVRPCKKPAARRARSTATMAPTYLHRLNAHPATAESPVTVSCVPPTSLLDATSPASFLLMRIVSRRNMSEHRTKKTLFSKCEGDDAWV